MPFAPYNQCSGTSSQKVYFHFTIKEELPEIMYSCSRHKFWPKYFSVIRQIAAQILASCIQITLNQNWITQRKQMTWEQYLSDIPVPIGRYTGQGRGAPVGTGCTHKDRVHPLRPGVCTWDWWLAACNCQVRARADMIWTCFGHV